MSGSCRHAARYDTAMPRPISTRTAPRYASTIPDIDAWRIQWTDPVTRNFLQMIGRAEGRDIVQLGTRPDGQLARWSFRDITANSFLWRGEVSADAGATWRIVTEFTATRRQG